MNGTTVVTGAAALALIGWAGLKAWQRLLLSRAKHPSLTGHARWSKRVARQLPGYAYDESMFFNSDGAGDAVVQRRRDALSRLSDEFARRFAQSLAATSELQDSLADLQFISAYRVPYQYSPYLRQHLRTGSCVVATDGVTVTDLDGNRFLDLTGSYGVNLLGNDVYKQTIADGSALVASLGPVLGAYHPCMLDNVRRLRVISGQEQVSFHMSGTEAVMQAVRLARYHTGRRYLVRFSGAYHGWWEDVQPGPGNPMPARETYTLRDMHENTLRVLRTRRDIACVLVNPLQAMHPNANAPGDSSLVDSSRGAHYDRAAYTEWLHELRDVCTARDIVLIFDEVFVGFRLAPGGAQEYFGVRADMVTYGKTLGGGLPVGVVCGRRDLMKRYREDRPADLCFARGTFNSHPYVMGAMNAFLHRLDKPATRALYEGLDERWNHHAQRFNERMQASGLPVRAVNLSSIWTLTYTTPSRYNWMLQYYLRLHGLALSWIGTGRLIFSLNYTDADVDAVTDAFVAAGLAMQRDGWWHEGATQTNKEIRRTIAHEMLRAWFRRFRPAGA
ncbi:aminotransferase class III-fold pyridoxal phosphate-dependent enzyme [Variovorax sp. VNK109]|uniref:aminotransferase class III-fold pyridoxal phosphate-dependent enzyme n=1 Tax=Variovorax sp. VNK109 TaxID=3400919 RepID=UPI003C100194